MAVINIGRNWESKIFQKANKFYVNVTAEIPKDLYERMGGVDGEFLDDVLTPDIDFGD